MVMTWVFTALLAISVIFALSSGQGAALAAAVPVGAQAGITLALSLAGSICLWTGVGKLMEKVGLTSLLSKLLRPVLNRLFPDTKHDPVLAGFLSANICANFLGLGNAATPMGLQAVQRMKGNRNAGVATDQMCRLVVLNTASIQLLPTTVAAIRATAGCLTPFDILPQVWATSICSLCAGLLAAFLLQKVWHF